MTSVEEKLDRLLNEYFSIFSPDCKAPAGLVDSVMAELKKIARVKSDNKGGD